MRLSEQRIQRRINELEGSRPQGSVSARSIRLSADRQVREANEAERDLAALEAALEADVNVTFTAPARARMTRRSTKRLSRFVTSLQGRLDAAIAAT